MPRFTLPANVTWEGGLAGFQIRGPFNAATVVKVGAGRSGMGWNETCSTVQCSADYCMHHSVSAAGITP